MYVYMYMYQKYLICFIIVFLVVGIRMFCYMYSSMEWVECPIMYRSIAVHDQGLKLQTIYEVIIEYTDLTHAHMHRCSIKLERCL